MDSFCAQAPSYFDFTADTSSEENLDYFGEYRERINSQNDLRSPELFAASTENEEYRASRRRSRSVSNLPSQLPDQLCKKTDPKVISKNNRKCNHEIKENIYKMVPDHKSHKYQSMAEQINNFHRKTPTRFHTVSSKAEAVRVLSELNSNKYIKPQTPRLLTKTRARPIFALSAKEREEMEFREAQKNKFKPGILSQKDLKSHPSKPILPKPRTKIEPFNLTKPRKKPIIEEKPFVFKAQPLPIKILQAPVGIKERPPPKITEPKTPNIKKVQQKVVSNEAYNRNHIAQPMPEFNTPKPCRAIPKLTCPKTPNFASKLIKEEAEKKFKAKLEQEEKEAKVKATFKARPPKVLHMRPFQPNHKEHEVKFEEFHLSSEERAKARKAYDEHLKLKEEELNRKREEINALQKKREEKEIALQRKRLVLKAQPIKHYKPFQIKPSGKEITVPVTPSLGSKRINSSKEEL